MLGEMPRAKSIVIVSSWGIQHYEGAISGHIDSPWNLPGSARLPDSFWASVTSPLFVLPNLRKSLIYVGLRRPVGKRAERFWNSKLKGIGSCTRWSGFWWERYWK